VGEVCAPLNALLVTTVLLTKTYDDDAREKRKRPAPQCSLTDKSMCLTVHGRPTSRQDHDCHPNHRTGISTLHITTAAINDCELHTHTGSACHPPMYLRLKLKRQDTI